MRGRAGAAGAGGCACRPGPGRPTQEPRRLLRRPAAPQPAAQAAGVHHRARRPRSDGDSRPDAAPGSAPRPAQAGAAQAPGAPRPTRLPPVGSPPLVRFIQLEFPTQGDVSVIDAQTYLYYIQTSASRPTDGVWVPYKEETVLEDFKRLWATNFLDNLWIDVQ